MDKAKILIVDDEPAITQSLKRSLRDTYDVFTANTVSQALEILAEHQVAVILTDQRMPDMQGVDFLKAARVVQPGSLSLLLSGYSDVQALITALNLTTVRGFIGKPWDNQDLQEKVASTVKEYRAVFNQPQILEDSQQNLEGLKEQLAYFQSLVQTLTHPESESAALLPHSDTQIESLYAPPPVEISARLLGQSSLREANPDKFQDLQLQYAACLDQAFDQRVYRINYQISNNLKNLAADLCLLRAGPRDVVAIHNTALQAAFEKYKLPRRQVYVEEGRLLLLELMGSLVHAYRSFISRK
jgi:YesN/AraC family two-component response regulator